MGTAVAVERWRVVVELAGEYMAPGVQRAAWAVSHAICAELREQGLEPDEDRRRATAVVHWSNPIVLERWAVGDRVAVGDAIRRAVQDAPLRALAVRVIAENDDGGAER